MSTTVLPANGPRVAYLGRRGASRRRRAAPRCASPVLRLREEGGDDLGHLGPHVLDPGDGPRRRPRTAARTSRKCSASALRGGLAHVADAERVEEAAAAVVACCARWPPRRFSRALLAHALEARRAARGRGGRGRRSASPAPTRTSCAASLSPRPSMSIAARRGEVAQARLRAARGSRAPVQRMMAPSSSLTAAAPQTGQRVGEDELRSRRRRLDRVDAP